MYFRFNFIKYNEKFLKMKYSYNNLKKKLPLSYIHTMK